jgi:hypothetical protein
MYYKEHSGIITDSIFKLYQNVRYDRPNIIDEEFSYTLSLTFLDTTAAKAKKNLNLATDTLIVKSRYGVFSIWNWEGEEKTKVTGRIKIIAWDKNAIKIKETIFVSDEIRKETKKYKGIRTFKRSE